MTGRRLLLKAENGAIVGDPLTLDGAASFTTDASGSASTEKLYLGCYKLVETKAPTGYILDSSEILVDLTYAGQEVEVTSSGATASNQYQNVNITVPKTMESATEYGIDASDYVRYVTFGLYANEDITAANGSAIPQDGLIQTVELSDNMTTNFNANSHSAVTISRNLQQMSIISFPMKSMNLSSAIRARIFRLLK